MQTLKCTYHIITGGTEGICPTYVHCSLIQLVQDSNIVSAFHLQPDPAETIQISHPCHFGSLDLSWWHTDQRWGHSFSVSKIIHWEILSTIPFKWFTDAKTKMPSRKKKGLNAPCFSPKQLNLVLATLKGLQTSCIPFDMHWFCFSSVTCQYTCISNRERDSCHSRQAQRCHPSSVIEELQSGSLNASMPGILLMEILFNYTITQTIITTTTIYIQLSKIHLDTFFNLLSLCKPMVLYFYITE